MTSPGWKVADTAEKAFEITLGTDGSAKADRGEGMTGTWKEEGAAVITWGTGWTTKISKDVDKYTKSAFKKGEVGRQADQQFGCRKDQVTAPKPRFHAGTDVAPAFSCAPFHRRTEGTKTATVTTLPNFQEL